MAPDARDHMVISFLSGADYPPFSEIGDCKACFMKILVNFKKLFFLHEKLDESLNIVFYISSSVYVQK